MCSGKEEEEKREKGEEGRGREEKRKTGRIFYQNQYGTRAEDEKRSILRGQFYKVMNKRQI